MLCLFRNSQIHPKLDPVAVALSWAATLYWLYFAFIEKALLDKIQTGNALLIDLVFGFPLVIFFAIMVYATVYWAIKLLLVVLWPVALIEKPQSFETDLAEDLNFQGEFQNELPQENQPSKASSSHNDKPPAGEKKSSDSAF